MGVVTVRAAVRGHRTVTRYFEGCLNRWSMALKITEDASSVFSISATVVISHQTFACLYNPLRNSITSLSYCLYNPHLQGEIGLVHNFSFAKR